jgi:hypothetical protein
VNRSQALVRLISRLKHTALMLGEIEAIAREIAEIAGFDAEERRACGLCEIVASESKAFRDAMPEPWRRKVFERCLFPGQQSTSPDNTIALKTALDASRGAAYRALSWRRARPRRRVGRYHSIFSRTTAA